MEKFGRNDSLLDALTAQTIGASGGASSASGDATDHGSLLGLADDDHSQYMHIVTARTITAQHSFSPGSAQAPFVLGANAQSQLVTGLRADELNKSVIAGNGLTGGGSLNSNVTINVAAGDGITAAADYVAVSLATTSGLNFLSGDLRVGAGNGISVGASSVAVDQTYAFTWSGLHIFNAGARIAAGQNLEFGTDVAISRKSADVMQINSGDEMQSASFTSGFTGWRITAAGDAEFNNVLVRGELAATVFRISEITATAGTQGVFKSATVVHFSDYTSPAAVGNSNTLFAKNSPDGATMLAVNDIIRMKAWTAGGIKDSWLTVTAILVNYTTHTTYTVRLESGSTNAAFVQGVAIADYGPSGSGLITLSADGAVGSSANMSIATHAGSPWSTQTLHVRLGNLNGSYGLVTNLYGIGMGDYSGGNYLKYDTSNGFTLKAGGGNVLLDGDGITLEGQDGVDSSYLNYKRSAWRLGYLRGYVVGSSPNRAGYMYLVSEYEGTGTPQINLSARGNGLIIGGGSSGHINLFGTDVRIPNGGLWVGSDASAPDDGEVWTTGSVLVNETANAKQTVGATINQGANDDEILTFKSSDVAQGATDVTESDTFGLIAKVSGTLGGVLFRGFSEDANAMNIQGIATTDNTTKTTAASAAITLRAYKISGTTIGAMGTDANLVVISDTTTAKFIFDKEGSAHADTEWVTFDAHNDVALLDRLEGVLTTDTLKGGFGAWIEESRMILEELGIAHFDERPGHAMINTTRLGMLHTGAIRQLAARIERLEAALL